MNANGAGACFHCGQALPAQAPQVLIDGAMQSVCCAGCATAAQWIRDAGLVQYYRLRQGAAARLEADAGDYAEWLHPDILAAHAQAVTGGLEMTVLVRELRCAACAWLIDQALTRMDASVQVRANAATGRVRLRWDPQRIELPQLLRQMAVLGFAPALAGSPAQQRAEQQLRRRELLRLGVAGLGAMQAMMFAEALYLDSAGQMAPATRDFLRWTALLVSTPVVFFAGWPFIAGLLRDLRQRVASMDLLAGGAILLAYFASAVETVRGGTHVWFDAAVMFVFLLLAARQLETWARRRARARTDALAHTLPAFACRERGDGSVERVPLARLRAGDGVRVAAGEALPADGVLLDAPAALDESLLSGESLPLLRQPGAPVLAGSSSEAPLRLRVSAAGAATQLAGLVRLVDQAQALRPRLARRADRVAAWFISVLLLAALAAFALWWPQDPARAFEIFLAVLVVSCPCALSLAIPAALAAAQDSLARIGVLVLRADALENLARVDTVLLDKTGTLTLQKTQLEHVEIFAGCDRARALELAAALQAGSAHPLASAFGAAANQSLELSEWQQVAGQGLQARVAGLHYRLGRGDFAAGGRDDGGVWLGDGQRPLARFGIRQQLRADAPALAAALRAQGVQLELASGDAPAAVQEIARVLDIRQARARQSPQDKLVRARELQQQGHVVAMLGDGVNDAPVLAGANVSFAFAGGAVTTHRAADLLLTGDSLLRVPQAVAIARRTRRIVRQNLAWALAYNALALPFAALGWISPGLAALGMCASSLLVVLNALRLRKVAP
ncbi:heavy metal translocating P-type ATPase [Tahibacter harae]|uniref:Heavy metal translocating P-type ATPase n=1 Tax=Tahibacter harae TaxID=2963937 RepID=A0ABT1QWH4_9GAMM|nr:heavy metal translocating P-type ATPase [Tahibacter harae]